jgi:hypothetical protein
MLFKLRAGNGESKLRRKESEEWERELKRLSDEYVQWEIRSLQQRRKMAHGLEALEELEDRKEGVKVQIQQIARDHAGSAGSTLRFVDTKDICVEVQSPQAQAEYSLKKARKHWDKDLVRKVLMIDSKAVRELVASGELSEKKAKRAALEREPMTPRVIVKLKNEK